ncbi:MAG: phosphate transport system regulatory protein PhoU [Ignavibacteria bacterium GWB2_35_12]|nr:MAG: phosphate transport system regulatory protein PhoU [Ignavibacteria bacterium GWA2_35_8]OGU38872.1 MAG: phosphate transport system regulatory protein PhoU [Ignavibacteria bacterium GWB2_35_12]OGU94398.1 MAG: phosphate transport system regulatory protein PhoU [Ignavibacteria bacterium RIFOXYA2_FULL_35_10]OGV20326.1 MAG: phosphate transport system regulatory protein PhoU [Ignavibacteria bacterium RIFOXYC2_FULL_35_21]
MLEDQLNKLKAKIVGYAFHVESMINKSIKGLMDKDSDLLNEVMKHDEKSANKLEMNIDKNCVVIIAQYSPLAVNLRTILMIMKMNNDLERMADHCVNISRCALDLIDEPNQTKILTSIHIISEQVNKMLKDSINSFIENDINLAKDVCSRDKIVDDAKNNLMTELIGVMHEDKSMINVSMQFIDITRNLERIADLTTNIAEDVVFAIDGEVIKHHKKNKINETGINVGEGSQPSLSNDDDKLEGSQPSQSENVDNVGEGSQPSQSNDDDKLEGSQPSQSENVDNVGEGS